MVEECTENVEQVKLARITLIENENKHKCISCMLYIVLFSIPFTINDGIGTYFVYYKYMNHWYLKKYVIHIKLGARTQITI